VYLAVLDKGLNLAYVIDDYKSVIWTERYNKYGDFELVVPGTYENYQKFRLDTYLFTPESQKLMIIEQLEWTEEYNKASEIKITGRSLESILDRRIVGPIRSSDDPWFYYVRGFNDFGDNIITSLVADAFAFRKPTLPRHVGWLRWMANPKDLPAEVLLGRDGAEMKLPQRRFSTVAEQHSKPAGPGSDLRLSQYSIDLSSTLEGSLYEIVTTILGYYGGGFAIDLELGNPFRWWGYVYKGLDRTRSQTKRSPVIFSPKMDNLSKAVYVESVADYKSVIYSGLVSSQSVGEAHEYGDTKPKTQLANNSKTIGISGLERREGYLQNIQINEMTGVRSDRNGSKYSVLGEQTMSKEQVLQKIEDACNDELYKHGKKTVYTGEADMTTMYRYGEDFFMGDLVQLENGHGLSETAILTEYTRSSSESEGDKFYPTFTKPDESSAWHH
jgi:hypothetical protein